MKIQATIVSFILATVSARAEILFQGYMTTTGKSLFVLSVDKTRTSGWLAVGQDFDGFSILDFDPKTECLTIEKEGQRRILHFLDGKIQTANTTTGQTTKNPIIISIGEKEKISVSDDEAVLSALKVRFEALAAMSPQPAINIRSPGDATFDRIRAVMDLCRASGITRFSIGN